MVDLAGSDRNFSDMFHQCQVRGTLHGPLRWTPRHCRTLGNPWRPLAATCKFIPISSKVILGILKVWTFEYLFLFVDEHSEAFRGTCHLSHSGPNLSLRDLFLRPSHCSQSEVKSKLLLSF